MKNLILLLAIAFLTACCSNGDSDNADPISKLPSATQTGANTAGCLVNGQVFLPKGSNQFGPTLSCFYQQDQGTYHFGLNISDKTNGIKSVNLSLNPLQLTVNNTYLLSEIINGQFNYASNFAEFIIYSDTFSDNRFTTNIVKQGTVTITKLDTQQKIISGLFWYDAINQQGEVVQIREGRFDMRYVN